MNASCACTTCTCQDSARKKINIFNADPTKTITLRRLFVNQFRKRFNKLIALVKQSIIQNDVFGLNKTSVQSALRPPSDSWEAKVKPMQTSQLKYSSNTEKVTQFMDWLDRMEQLSIYQTVSLPRVGGIKPVWQNIYIASAYKRGILWGRRNIKKDPALLAKLDLKSSDIPTDTRSIDLAFSSGVHADRVGTIYTRAYSDLEGITTTMDAQISRILADGLILGENPRTIAANIADRINKIGIHRATLLARTEVIRAHHLASIQTYRNFGVEGVTVLAEWNTAGDARVCELCYPLEGKVFTLNKIEGMIPVHPQCRCGAVPVVVEEEEE